MIVTYKALVPRPLWEALTRCSVHSAKDNNSADTARGLYRCWEYHEFGAF